MEKTDGAGEEEEDDGGIEMSQFFKDGTMQTMIADLKARRIGGIYMPNVRWFSGEERGGGIWRAIGEEMANMADVFVNDAFGSWQPHVSTFDVAKLLPSYAGLLMQRELDAMRRVLEPVRPFVAVVAGSKVNTKIGTLINVAKKCDALILGGVIYNVFIGEVWSENQRRGRGGRGVSEDAFSERGRGARETFGVADAGRIERNRRMRMRAGRWEVHNHAERVRRHSLGARKRHEAWG